MTDPDEPATQPGAEPDRAAKSAESAAESAAALSTGPDAEPADPDSDADLDAAGADLRRLTRRVASIEADLFGLATRLTQVTAASDRHATSLDELEDVLTELAALGPPAPAAGPGTSAPSLLPAASAVPSAAAGAGSASDGQAELPSPGELRAWVDAHVAPLVRKTTTTGEGGGLRWCRSWWEHRDAIDRFTALLLVHRDLAAENAPSWRSVFLRDHLDPHLAQLTSTYGPFHACHPRRHSPTAEPLGHDRSSHDPRTDVDARMGAVAAGTPGGTAHAHQPEPPGTRHDAGPTRHAHHD